MLKPDLLIYFIFFTLFAYNAPSGEKAEDQIREVMHQQELAWNAGDIDAFMQGYWNSDSLRFISSRGTTYGWQKTLENYKRSYPDKETMGILTFEIIDIDVLSQTSAFVLGKWHFISHLKWIAYSIKQIV